MRDAIRSFARIAARVRAEIWPVTVEVTLPDASTAELAIAKSASKIERVQQEQGAGWVKRTIATFNFPATGTFIPGVKDQWEITASDLADEVGSRWQCFDVVRAAAGMEHRCVAFKLD